MSIQFLIHHFYFLCFYMLDNVFCLTIIFYLLRVIVVLLTIGHIFTSRNIQRNLYSLKAKRREREGSQWFCVKLSGCCCVTAGCGDFAVYVSVYHHCFQLYVAGCYKKT